MLRSLKECWDFVFASVNSYPAQLFFKVMEISSGNVLINSNPLSARLKGDQGSVEPLK